MTKIGFIGVGATGGPMVGNLVGAGHAVTAYDVTAAPDTLFVNGGFDYSGAIEPIAGDED